MKCLSQENLTKYDTLIKDYIKNKIDPYNLFCYGVEFDIRVSDPHLKRIGNLTYHKTLPIQSQLKGCVAQGNKIMYYLNEDDWKFRQIPDNYIFKDQKITAGDFDLETFISTFSYTHDLFSDLRYKDLYIRIKSQDTKETQIVTYKIISIDTTTKTATFKGKLPAGAMPTDSFTIEFGSVLNGYDGTVRIHCPKFYIKSEEDGNKRRVWITQLKFEEGWQEQPECLIDAYYCTTLRSVPADFGYLSTLKVNDLVSIVNSETYCRGGVNNANLDSNLETAPERCELNKPINYMSISIARTRCPENSHLLSYNLYKNIIYWLWVIEYANFNSQETFNPNLTDDGYKQGGMGLNLALFNNFNLFDCHATIPNGFGNKLGNNTGLLSLTIHEFDIKYSSYNIGNFIVYTSNIECNRVSNSFNITKIKNTSVAFKIDTKYQFGSVDFEISGLTDNQNIIFYTDDNKNTIDIKTVSEDGVVTVDWPEYSTPTDGKITYACIRFANILSNCNITITTKTINNRYEHQNESYYSICRWRGMDALHSNLNLGLDGILINPKNNSNNYFPVYVCDDPEKFSDNYTDEGYYKAGDVLTTQNTYISSFDIGENALIIPNGLKGSSNTFMCDTCFYNPNDKTLKILGLSCGGALSASNATGLSYFNFYFSTNNYVFTIKTASEL